MKLLTALVFAFSATAFAGHHDHDKMKEEMKKLPFDQQKAMMQDKLNAKSTMLEEAKTCVNNAKDKDALWKCKDEMKEEKMAMKDEMKEKMKEAKKKQ